MTKHQPTPLIACHECDLLMHEIPLPPGRTACCPCCGATLYRNQPDSIGRSLALALASAILYLLANAFPILGINLQGNGNAVTLLQAVHDLWNQKMHLVSSLTFVTAILVPALELSMMLYLLIPLYLGRAPAGVCLIMRLLQAIKPWGMIEVFMLGILVSLVKLVQDFKIIPGIALWSFGGLTLLLAALASSFNPRDVWAHLDKDHDGVID
jgi:paraquat-inducible protein A